MWLLLCDGCGEDNMRYGFGTVIAMWLWGLRCDHGDGDVDMGMAMLL